jgi:hypothetical protein
LATDPLAALPDPYVEADECNELIAIREDFVAQRDEEDRRLFERKSFDVGGEYPRFFGCKVAEPRELR